MKQIVIIGNGIAGITAARHIRKRAEHPITVISGESDHFFSRTALMYIYMGHMTYEHTKPYEDWFWPKNRIELIRAWVEKVDASGKTVQLANGQQVPWDVLVIASGSRSNRFGWPGQNLRGVQGLYSLQDLELMEQHTRGIERAVVVGGGLIGIEMAEMLHSRQIPTTFLVREQSWMERVLPAEESRMINREIRDHHIDLRLGTELAEVLVDDAGRVRGVRTTAGEEISCQFVGLTVGVHPNIAFLEGSGVECDRGVLVDDHLCTNVPDVYAVGDCAQVRAPLPGRRPVEPLWYTGRAMGETVAHTICGTPTAYDPGLWFNSAKFFDLEYQVYGQVPAQLDDDHETLYWERSDGKASLRVNHRRHDRAVTGFNLMGIRYRHELCAAWLRAGTPVEEVLGHLGAANFDPEFYAQHERSLVEVYNRRHPDHPVKLRRRRGLRGFLEQLRRVS